MSTAVKGAYWRALKALGHPFEHHYREYKEAELRDLYEALTPEQQAQYPVLVKTPQREKEAQPVHTIPAQSLEMPETRHSEVPETRPSPPVLEIPFSDTPLDRYASMRGDWPMVPLRRDSQNRVWFQEEVRQPGYAAPRARRKIQYMETGVERRTFTMSDGSTETVEVAGNEQRASEVRITLPSYQVGIYQDPRYPFKVHVYADQEGFDLEEVEGFYGGSEMVPADVKRIYISNVLCYDIRTTLRAIQNEAVRLRLI